MDAKEVGAAQDDQRHPETWEAINRTVLASARQEKLEPGKMVRLDSTVTAALMHEPSDSSLLWDGVRVMVRLLQAADALVGGAGLDAERDAPVEYHDRLTVAKTFALAIDEAAKLHPAAEPLIVHAALLAPEPIPVFLFSEGREKFGGPLASQLADDGLDEALAALRALLRMLILAERVEALQKEAAALKEFNAEALIIKAKDQIIALSEQSQPR